MNNGSCLILILLALLTTETVLSKEITNQARAKFNYQMFCQGCHTASGLRHKSVPQLKGVIGHFIKSQQGREYLVRVPGSANSALDDSMLAEVLNWMLLEFADDSLPASWDPYKSDEVATYRKEPLLETIKHRKKLIQDLSIQ